MKKTFNISATARVTMEHETGAPTSQVKAVDFWLDISDKLNKEKYTDKDMLPNKDGSKTVTIAFIQGLVANIKFAEKSGFMVADEHLHYIVAEITKGLAVKSTVTNSRI